MFSFYFLIMFHLNTPKAILSELVSKGRFHMRKYQTSNYIYFIIEPIGSYTKEILNLKSLFPLNF